MQNFSKKYRIKKKSEIYGTFKNGHRFLCEDYKIVFSENKENFDRIAVLVSRKTGNAVKRNKIKRFFREVFRKNRIDFPPFFDVLIQPQSGIDLNNEMVQCYKKWQEKAKRLVL